MVVHESTYSIQKFSSLTERKLILKGRLRIEQLYVRLDLDAHFT